MEWFCGTPFWETSNSTTSGRSADLSLCFQDTVLLWLPCSLLWLCAPFEARAMREGDRKERPWTALNAAKVVLSLFLIVVACIEFVLRLSELLSGASPFPVHFVAPPVRIAAYVLTMFLVRGGRLAGFYTSAPLFLFWMMMTIASTIRFRTVILMAFIEEEKHRVANLGFLFTIHSIYFLITWGQFVLSFFAYGTSDKPLKAGACPEQRASYPSKLIFWWFNGIITKGYRQPLQMSDIWDLDKANSTPEIAKKFDELYRGRKETTETGKAGVVVKSAPATTPQQDFLKPLYQTFRHELLVCAFQKLVASLLAFLNPILLDLLITFMKSDESSWNGVWYATAMFFASMSESLFNAQYEYRIYLVSMRMRSALINAIYRKALTLSSGSKGSFTTGEIVNLMAVDTQRIMKFTQVFNGLWATPIQVVVATYLLWQQLGVATLGGLASVVALLPVNAVVTGFLRTYQAKVMQEKDRRIKLMNEILAGIKVLKLYAWEEAFEKRVQEVRNDELGCLRVQAYIDAGVVFSFACAPFVMSLIAFTAYVMSDSNNILDANKAFVSLMLFYTLRLPLAFLPLVISKAVMMFISCGRINAFLQSEDIDPTAVHHNDKQAEISVNFKNASFAWSRNSPATLSNINLKVPKGSLVAIVGSVASGKSSLLSACLGELVKLEGSATVNGTLAYSPQQAWMQNDSVKENILFGKNYDDERYEKIIEACALEHDLAVLPAGDETEIGEKGLNLSGGQKQRISIARAVYSGRDIYLFDDPLSAVDANVGKHIFDKVIGPRGIIRKKTRILVTQSLWVLPHVSTIVVLRDGFVTAVGTFHELVSRGGAFADFLIQFIREADPKVVSEGDIKVLSEVVSQVHTPNPELAKYCSQVSGSESDRTSLLIKGGFLKGCIRPALARRRSSVRHLSKFKRDSKAKLTDDETVLVGSVKWRVYRDLAKATGEWIMLGILVTFVICHVFQVLGSMWVSSWTNDAQDPFLARDPGQRNYRLVIYGIYGFAEAVFLLLGCVFLQLAMLHGARVVHQGMLHHVFRAPMSFFDTTPTGRIINRFSKDVDAADMTLPLNVRLLILHSLRTVVAFLLIAMQTPIFLAAVAPIMCIYYFVQKAYVATSRQLRRLESITRSPIYVHLSETLAGTSSIRAYEATNRFVALSDQLTDNNHSTYFPSIVAIRWLSTRLEFLGYCIVFISAILVVLNRGTLSPGLAGLAVGYSLAITVILKTLVQSMSEVETNLVSMERCFEYTRISQEAPWENPDFKPDPSWPTAGEVVFREYSTRYREDIDLVLDEISCTINPGEKVGIVGRTGAGKSSLTLALFRIIEACNGDITIDGLDISTLGLYDLRSRLTIIPQEPVLFSGTLRWNLDPFEIKTDDNLWWALQHSHLKDFVSGIDKGLLHEITEGGENISVGQRQLVCLARALLRKSRILILDEATAAIDMETDELVQATIRREFSDCTIITIAHRLNTILDYDRVIVLDKGHLAESGPPYELLKKSKSRFYSMARDANLVQELDQA
ncbi:multidrug resistance-associated protein 1-like [Haemaphysalis longicornis]